MFDTGLEPMTSVVGGRRLDDWATEAPLFISILIMEKFLFLKFLMKTVV